MSPKYTEEERKPRGRSKRARPFIIEVRYMNWYRQPRDTWGDWRVDKRFRTAEERDSSLSERRRKAPDGRGCMQHRTDYRAVDPEVTP